MKKWFIEDIKRAHTFLSVQLATLLVALGFAYDYLPALREYFSPEWMKWIAVAVIVARVIKQKGQSS